MASLFRVAVPTSVVHPRGQSHAATSKGHIMLTRTKREKLSFGHAFALKGVDRILPAGEYEIVTDEALIEDLSFPVFRRVATWIMAPTTGRKSTIEMHNIDPVDLAAAFERDRTDSRPGAANA